MSGHREKVVVAMSGGVDSSVAACLLVEQGYEVIGLFMRTGVKAPAEPVQAACTAGAAPATAAPAPDRHRGCCSASDAADARFVAGMLGIPFYVLNFEKEFDALIDYFADEYAAGRTPNPCVVCNDRLKFGRIVEYADAVGASYVATGHYARIGRMDGVHVRSVGPTARAAQGLHVAPVSNGAGTKQDPSLALGLRFRGARTIGAPLPDSSPVLLRAVDAKKDQSYVLFGLDRAILNRVMFPIGHLEKGEVRRIADRFQLPNRAKPDSVEICFAPDRDYARVVRQRRPDAFVGGEVLNDSGAVIGRHQGIGQYTIGQRRGLGIAAGKPVYVTALDVQSNTVTLGDRDALLANGLTAERASFLVDVPAGPFRADAKIRYLHTAAEATVERVDIDRVRVTFDEPQRAVTPGQAAVFYDGDVVLGGAWIERAIGSG